MNKYSRRSFIGTIGTTPLLFQASTAHSSTNKISIGISVTQSAAEEYGSDGAMEISHIAESLFGDLSASADLDIGPDSIVEMPDSEKWGFARSLSWWRSNGGNYTDSNVLLLAESETNWGDTFGITRIDGQYAVAKGYEYMNTDDRYKRVPLHEIGHNFGLEHEHGNLTDGVATIMVPRITPYEADLSFSKASRSQLL